MSKPNDKQTHQTKFILSPFICLIPEPTLSSLLGRFDNIYSIYRPYIDVPKILLLYFGSLSRFRLLFKPHRISIERGKEISKERRKKETPFYPNMIVDTWIPVK
jgi:hypothetical protein